MAFLAETRRRCRQRPLLFLSLLLLAVLALAAADQTQERWTDDKCDRKFKPNYVSCVPQMSNSCTCKKAYWKKIDPGTHCCHKNAVQKCASINTTLVPEFGSCTLHPKCNWSPWTITGCTTACGEGQNKYLRTCSSNSATEAKTGGTCGETPAAWTEWHITPCSVSCGDGTETHSRNCVGTCAGTCKRGVTQTEKASCTVGVPYQWTAWSDFGLCSNSCGPGTHTRKRTCFGNCNAGNSACALNAVETQTQDCFSGEPSSWSDWTPWGACEACNFGTQSRTRTCDGSCSGNCSLHAQESQSRVCAGSRPSGWSQWTPWSTWCNVDCGEGNVTSRKTCEGENMCELTEKHFISIWRLTVNRRM